MSDSNREQVSSYLTDMWNSIGVDIAQSRNIDLDSFNAIVNTMPMMQDTDYLLQSNLVDTLLYESEMKTILFVIDIGEDDKIPSASVIDMKSVKPTKTKSSKIKSDCYMLLENYFEQVQAIYKISIW